MKAASLCLMGSLLLGGLANPVVAAEPTAKPSAPAAADQDIAREQTHLQTVSSSYSVQVADDENLPLQFRNTERPKGQTLLNLSF